jgi:hypothetical protein
MSEEYDDNIDWLEENRPRDVKIDEAKNVLIKELFLKEPDGVFYQRQIEIFFERQFFHWITAKALNELAEEGKIGVETKKYPNIHIRFYWSRKNRYWTRRAKAIEKLVMRFSDPVFTHGLGRHGEMMFDAALPHGGFLPNSKNVRSYGGIEWTKTKHDLDRVFMRYDIYYGIEIKNTLSYIDRFELETKLEMCEFFGLVPLFIMRMAPANYIEMIHEHGGFALIFEWQLYPFGHESFATEIKKELRLKVDCPRAIQEGTIQRLVKWHEAKLRRKSV